MKLPKLLFAFVFALFMLPSVCFAVTDVTSSELQNAVNILMPGENSVPLLEGYLPFEQVNTGTISGGIWAQYEARLVRDPGFEQEPPVLEMVIYSYKDQAAAAQSYEALLGMDSSKEWQDRWLYYERSAGQQVDVFGRINAGFQSFHLVHASGNLIFQTSLYREGDTYNMADFKRAVADRERLFQFLKTPIETSQTALEILFPPTDSDFQLNSSFSNKVGESLPLHGEIEFEFYTSDPKHTAGTLLDSSGLNAPSEGDLYLYMNADGRLFAGIYTPELTANCTKQSNWYRVASQNRVRPYEWNKISLHYGVGGFFVALNGKQEAFCEISQARSENVLYLGDFPEDSLKEGALGYAKNIVVKTSLTETGKAWDDVLQTQLFIDLPNTDPDVDAFQLMKEMGVFTGSNGKVNPEEYLTRAQMVKVLLKAFDEKFRSPSRDLSFVDVSESAWYYDYVARAFELGVVTGYADGHFWPEQKVDRAEFFTMLMRIRGEEPLDEEEFEDVTSLDWFAQGAAYAKEQDLVTEQTFKPHQAIKRRDAARVLYDLLYE